jgi:DNA-directed RNA polymerase specialized sigma24 family protein
MLENSRNNRIDVREELLEVLHRNIALRNRYIHAVQPSAAWRRSLMKHLYMEGLSHSEVTTVMEVTEATMESNMISAELRCGRETN